MKPRAWTPWGKTISSRLIAGGIVRYHTPRHGGVRLSIERLNALPTLIRTCGTYLARASGVDVEALPTVVMDLAPELDAVRWFEEDVDMCLVTVAFPEHFSPVDVWSASMTLRRCPTPHYRPAVAFLDSPEAAATHQVCEGFVRDSGHLYCHAWSMTTPSGTVTQYFRVCDGRTAVVKRLPTDDIVSDVGPFDLACYGDRVTYSAS